MAEKLPNWRYEHGEVWLSDLPIAAGLWALDGAAWDGNTRWYYPGEDRASWDSLLRNGHDLKTLRVKVLGSHTERVTTRLIQDWVDKSPEGQGKHYRAGETAPIPRAIFHLHCGYEERIGEARVYRNWTEAEAEEWLRRWHRQGNAFLVIGLVFNDRINKLRNLLRDEHGMGQRRQMPQPTERAMR